MGPSIDLDVDSARRAAQYVRMSTDKQKYSTENQKDAIAAYAAARGLSIVRTYSDAGRSGLNIDGRKALQALIADVKNGKAGFDHILVYDVSRWGRFQDADESAYYEFICKEAGIQVLYCAELFENDGSLNSVLLKSIKRAMAGEFVRELSTKVFVGQSRIARMGYWRGGFPGYGLRRQLVDDGGGIKGQMEFGQRKSLQTDRVVLVHGPENEVATVQRIFRSFVVDGKRESQIAAELNADKIQTRHGRRWGADSLTKLLANESYLGHIVFNRTSAKLRGKTVSNPREMWIRRDHAFPRIVEPRTFERAQEIIRARRQGRSDQGVLERLAALRREKGYLTSGIINADEELPTVGTLSRRYGSLVEAYRLIDYQPSRLASRQNIAAARRAILHRTAAEIVRRIEGLGARASVSEDCRLLWISDALRVSLCVARATPERLGRMRWYAQVDRLALSDLTLIVRADLSDSAIEALYVIPTVDMSASKRDRIRITEAVFVGACRYGDVDQFCRGMLGGIKSHG